MCIDSAYVSHLIVLPIDFIIISKYLIPEYNVPFVF